MFQRLNVPLLGPAAQTVIVLCLRDFRNMKHLQVHTYMHVHMCKQM